MNADDDDGSVISLQKLAISNVISRNMRASKEPSNE